MDFVVANIDCRLFPNVVNKTAGVARRLETLVHVVDESDGPREGTNATVEPLVDDEELDHVVSEFHVASQEGNAVMMRRRHQVEITPSRSPCHTTVRRQLQILTNDSWLRSTSYTQSCLKQITKNRLRPW